MRLYYVYIMSSYSRTLYTGVTSDLVRRCREHKEGLIPGFTTKYRVNKLVYYASFTEVTLAIQWEKRIKGWVRAKKVALVDSFNPEWKDLASALDPLPKA